MWMTRTFSQCNNIIHKILIKANKKCISVLVKCFLKIDCCMFLNLWQVKFVISHGFKILNLVWISTSIEYTHAFHGFVHVSDGEELSTTIYSLMSVPLPTPCLIIASQPINVAAVKPLVVWVSYDFLNMKNYDLGSLYRMLQPSSIAVR